MKVTAYVTKPVPVEVEIDDRWKPMEFLQIIRIGLPTKHRHILTKM